MLFFEHINTYFEIDLDRISVNNELFILYFSNNKVWIIYKNAHKIRNLLIISPDLCLVEVVACVIFVMVAWDGFSEEFAITTEQPYMALNPLEGFLSQPGPGTYLSC